MVVRWSLCHFATSSIASLSFVFKEPNANGATAVAARLARKFGVIKLAGYPSFIQGVGALAMGASTYGMSAVASWLGGSSMPASWTS